MSEIRYYQSVVCTGQVPRHEMKKGLTLPTLKLRPDA